MAKVKPRNKKDSSETKVKFNFDIGIVNIITKYLFCDAVVDDDRSKVKKVIENMDIDAVKPNNLNLYIRLRTLEVLVTAMMDKGIRDSELLKMELTMNFEPGLSVLSDMVTERNSISFQECEYIRNFIGELVSYVNVFKNKDRVMRLLNNISETADYNVSYAQTFADLRLAVSDLMVSLNSGDSDKENLLGEFCFSDDKYRELLSGVLTKAKRPSAILQTGIRQLNAILSPGFHGGRLYTILGGSGRFKSGTLLNIADQIRRFNPQVVPYENGRRKCVLFVTLENSIEESLERIFDMYSGLDDEFNNKSVEDVIALLKDSAGFDYSNDPNNPTGGIDIAFRYRKNLSISTTDIYQFINELNSNGFEVIAVVVDYIKRLESIHPSNGDERVRMSFVGKELKSLAQFYQIPVITAMQLNRGGNAILDDAIRDSKQDITRFVGSTSIGNAWDIIEDSDWVAIINLELQSGTDRLFLTFKRVKIRGKKIQNASEYFNHPFTNIKNIRLEPDVYLDKPLSVASLATDLESIDEELGVTSNGREVPMLGPKIKEKKLGSSIKMQLHNVV